jgi:hypothetical protein
MGLGKLLVVLGLALTLAGAVLWKWPGALRWAGRLPGDIHTDRVTFPIVTCLVISLALTLALNLIARLFR